MALEYEPDLPTYEFVDPVHPLSKVLQGMLAARPNEHVRLVNTTDDDRKALVRVYSDRGGRVISPVIQAAEPNAVSLSPHCRTTAYSVEFRT